MRAAQRLVHPLVPALLVSAFAGCMFTGIERNNYTKGTAHVAYTGVDHPAVEVGGGVLMHGKTTVIHNTAEAVRSYTVAVRREFGEAPMYAFDATFWGTLGWFGMGVSLTYCTNFSAGALYFRPELGFGDAPIGPVWVRGFIGWPLHMTDKPVGPLPPLNHPHLGVRATIPLDTVAPTDYGD